MADIREEDFARMQVISRYFANLCCLWVPSINWLLFFCRHKAQIIELRTANYETEVKFQRQGSGKCSNIFQEI